MTEFEEPRSPEPPKHREAEIASPELPEPPAAWPAVPPDLIDWKGPVNWPGPLSPPPRNVPQHR